MKNKAKKISLLESRTKCQKQRVQKKRNRKLNNLFRKFPKLQTEAQRTENGQIINLRTFFLGENLSFKTKMERVSSMLKEK